MPIGPTLPPHLQSKRKRDSDESDSDDEDANHNTTRESSSPNSSEKRRKTLGPSLPPAPLEERPNTSPNGDAKSNSDSDSDDDYGPALPNAATQSATNSSRSDVKEPQPLVEPELKPTARDSWMLNPPQQDDLAARMDPTKIRPRKFNTGKAGRPPAGGGGGNEIDAIWTETPEQKAQRLKNSVMGVSSSTSSTVSATQRSTESRKQEDIETAQRLEKARGKSLLETHQGRKDKEEEDDPSKRAFDYEKDVGGARVGHAQKKELLGRAKEFGSRFSGGNYL